MAATAIRDQLAFPWADEGTERRRIVLLDWFDFLAAYARVCERWDARMAELAAAEARE